MNPSPRTPAFILCCAGCVLTGWVAGRGLAARPAQDSPASKIAQPAVAQSGEDTQPGAERAATPLTPDELRTAMEQVLAQRDDTARARALLAASRTFRPEDFAAAMTALCELGGPNGWKSSDLRDGLLCDWVARDLPSAREWLKGSSAEWSLGDGRHAWLRADPRGYVSWLRSLDDAHFQWVGGDSTLCEVDPEAALELAQRKGGPKLERAFGALAGRDPQAAAERVLSLPANAERAAAVGAVAAAWVVRDRAAAMAWAAQLDDAALATRAVGGIAEKLTEVDPPAAARFIGEHPQLGADWPLNQAMRRWVAQDEAAALGWARSVADSEQRNTAVATVIESLAKRDARAAADLWTAENAGAGVKPDTLNTVATALAMAVGPDEALRLIDTAPAAHRAQAEDAMRTAVAASRGWDGVAAIARGMPSGARRTEWLAQTAKFFAADGDLPHAQRLAATLTGPEHNAAMQAIGGVMLADDFEAGARMIADTGDRAALLSAIRGRFAEDGGRVRSWLARTPLLTPDEKVQLDAPAPKPASPR